MSGTGRDQSALWNLEDMVNAESMARVIDRYIEVLDLGQLGFTRTAPSETGRPCYPPQALCKLYVYGYENGIRSSFAFYAGGVEALKSDLLKVRVAGFFSV